jgi:hypothetical protein
MLETNHGPFRRFIARSSNPVIERQIMEWENIKQALLFLANGGKPDNNLIPASILSALREDPTLQQLLGRIPTRDPHGGHDAGWVRTAITWGNALGFDQVAIEGEEIRVEVYNSVTVASRKRHTVLFIL